MDRDICMKISGNISQYTLYIHRSYMLKPPKSIKYYNTHIFRIERDICMKISGNIPQYINYNHAKFEENWLINTEVTGIYLRP